MNDGRMARFRIVPLVGEASGAFGDLGVLLPYLVVLLGTGLLSPVPVFAGLAFGYGLVAVVYRVPISVQPMKVLGAMAIGGALGATELAWAGLAVGGVLLAAAATPWLAQAARAIPQSVVTGLQAGLGLMLGLMAFDLMRGEPVLAIAALAVLSLTLVWPRGPFALAVLAGGILLGGGPEQIAQATGTAQAGLGPVLVGLSGQLPLTLLNAVVVTAAVARSLYPDAVVSERRLAATSGLINLLTVPLGAMPLCHGASGVAAHHRFGARGIGAPLILAGLCTTAAVMNADVLRFIGAIPLPVVGALLAFAAADLVMSKRMRDARADCRPVIAAAAIATLFAGALAGLVAGLIAEVLRVRILRAGRRV